MSDKRGMTVLQALIALAIVAALQQLAISGFRLPNLAPWRWTADFLKNQAEAMGQLQPRQIHAKESDQNSAVIRINPHGHVDLARTLCFHGRCLTLQLAGGRLVAK